MFNYKIKLDKNKISLLFSTLALLFLVLNFLLYQILRVNNLKMLFRVLALFFSAFSLRSNSRINKRVIYFFIIMFILVLENADGIAVIYVFCMCFFMKDIEEREVIKQCYFANLVAGLFYLLFYFMKMVEVETYIIGERVRNNLGFININTGAAFFLSLSMILFLYKKNKITLIISIVTEWIVFRLTNSRTPMLVFVIFVLLLLLFRFVERKKVLLDVYKAVTNIVVFMYFLFPFFSEYILKKYPIINQVLSNRVAIFYTRIAEGTIKSIFFGGRTDWFIDNSVLCMFFLFGVTGILFFMYCVFAALHNLWRTKAYEYIAFIIAIILGSGMEGYLLSPEILFVYLFWFIILKYSVFSKEKHEIIVRKRV